MIISMEIWSSTIKIRYSIIGILNDIMMTTNYLFTCGISNVNKM